ncbi:MmcQ/YjbR family DNA-binding protein [Nonomuraea muscovyensis]
MLDYNRVRDLAEDLPGVEQSESWGTPSLKVGGKMILRQHEDPELMVVKVALDERDALTRERPEVFIVTPHYEKYPYMLVKTAALADDELRELIIEAWRMTAPKRLLKVFDERGTS